MVMRIGGLATGMEIDSIVKELMRAERVKVDKLEQQKQLIEWKQEIYNEISRELANFILNTKKELGLTRTSSTGLLLNNSVSSLDWVKRATLSNSELANVTVRADAVEGTYKVKVHRLAENWSAASSGPISINNEGEINTSNLAAQFGIAEDEVIQFTIKTNKNPEGFTINEEGINAKFLSIHDIVKQINDADIGVKAVYDYATDRFFLQTEQTGSDNTIEIIDNNEITREGESDPVNFISLLKLQYIGENGETKSVESGKEYKGKDALIDFGAAQGIVQSSNQFTINGINFDLKNTGEFTVNVATDIDGVYEKISNFVEKYNELINKLAEKLEEKRYRDYAPLTKEQKEEMSEEEIKLWEEKAKSGLIKNDGILDNLIYSLRTGLFAQVEGVNGIYNHLTQIGITTESYFSSKRGQLVIDETKLKTAIQNDVDSVLELIFKEPDSDLKYKSESKMTAAEIQAKRSQSGLISRLYDNLVVGIKGIVNKAGPGENAALYRNVNSSIMIDFIADYSGISMLDKDADDLNKRIVTLNSYLVRVENRYWQQFTQLEKAINRMNQQSMWLMQQFGGGY